MTTQKESDGITRIFWQHFFGDSIENVHSLYVQVTCLVRRRMCAPHGAAKAVGLKTAEGECNLDC